MRQERSKPLWDQLHLWLKLERTRVPDGSAIAKAIDYSLNRWEGFGRFLLDGDVPIDNNHVRTGCGLGPSVAAIGSSLEVSWPASGLLS